MNQLSPLSLKSVFATIVTIACSTWLVLADSPANLSDVISVENLEAELVDKTSELVQAVASREMFHESTGKRRLSAAQLAVISQALAQHEHASKHKLAGPQLRDAAIQIGRAASFEDTQSALANWQTVMEGQGQTEAAVEYDWAKLARTRALMDSLRERTDQVRKALRRSKDPTAESRNASIMAVLGLAIAAHADEINNPDDRTLWREYSLDFHREMTKAATALKNQDKPAILEHFTAAQAACDRCHEKFKR